MITSFILLFIIIVVVVVGVILGNLCCRWFSLYRWCRDCCRWWWWEAVTEAPTDMCNCLERWEGDISTKLFVNLSVSSLSLDYHQLWACLTTFFSEESSPFLVPFFTRGLSLWAYESCQLTLIVFSNLPWKIAIVKDKLYSLAPTWIISVCTMAYFLQHRMQWIISGRKLFPFSVSRAVFVTEELIREVGTNKTVNNVTDPLTSLTDED